ncbi:MAG: DNA-binding response regulator [Trueperaceae bacterium]|nr:DNA-binding response regulator [Trueperaceae bacterium]|tara:strand:- start:7949 stop:8614 length:666 start_codon:yes stop_codon:yes gene_type:complete
MIGASLLVVEDDPTVLALVSFHLERAGFKVVQAQDARSAWSLVETVDLIVLDRMLPDESGITFLDRIRRTAAISSLPILMLTARATENDRVEGLESGADDYMVKPFSVAELVARVRALLRRTKPVKNIDVDELHIDYVAVQVTFQGIPVSLTRREFELIYFLASHPGRVFSRSELLDRVWGEDFLGTERTVDQHIAQLRASLKDELIETVRGRGYRLVSRK